MKILSIYIRNINSLKGEWTIDFTKEPLAGAGLFAITGPTGSGKTTLLDAICLALYNQVPRIGKLSKDSIQKIGAVITRDTTNAMAAVTYECGKGVFTSSWSISRARTGNLSDYRMSVENANGQSLVQKKSDVPATNTELIGLSYEQFIRSMLLAQGEFSQLLKSKKEERTELLEQITGTDIYRKLGKRAFDKVRDLESSLKTIETRIAENREGLLPDDQLVALETSLTGKQQEKKQLQAQLSLWQQQLNTLQEHEKTTAEAVTKTENLATAQAGQAAFQSEAGQRLARFEGLLSVDKQRDAWRNAMEHQQQVVQTLFQEEQRLGTAQESVQTALHLAGEWLGRQMEADTVWGHWHVYRQQVEGLFAQKADKLQEYKAMQGQLQLLLQDIPHPEEAKWSHADQPHLDTLAQDWRTRQAQAKALLDHELQHPAAEVDRLHQTYREAISLWQQAHATHENAQKQLTDLLGRAEAVRLQITQLPDVQVLQQELEDVQERINDKELQRRLKQQLASLEEHRLQLTEDQPCPLCGSLHHPFAQEKPDVSTNEEDDRLVYLRKEFKAKQADLSRRQADEDNLTKSLQQLEKDVAGKEQEVLQAKASIDLHREALPAFLHQQPVAEAHRLQARQEDAWREYQDSSRLLSAAGKSLALFHQMQACVDDGLAIKEQLEGLYRGGDENAFKQAAAELELSLRRSQDQLHDIQQRLQKEQQKLQAADLVCQTTTNALLEKLQPLGYTSPDVMEAHWLPQEEAQQLREQRADWDKQVSTLQTQLQSLQERLQQLSEGLPSESPAALEEKWTAGTASMELLEGQVNVLFAQVKIQQDKRDKLSVLAIQKQELEGGNKKWRLLNDLIGDAKGKRFAEFAQDLTLRLLTRLANRRLVSLNNRYLLDVAGDGEDDNSLYLIDRELGDMRRSVHTASGGESFLLSLSLALGLSDLASRDVPLDSIFIDEGFGTLDPEVLDQTLDVLEHLQATDNKTIGIISHVGELKERIATQIQLQRDGQGYSRVEIV